MHRVTQANILYKYVAWTMHDTQKFQSEVRREKIASAQVLTKEWHSFFLVYIGQWTLKKAMLILHHSRRISLTYCPFMIQQSQSQIDTERRECVSNKGRVLRMYIAILSIIAPNQKHSKGYQQQKKEILMHLQSGIQHNN